ncbi:MAG: hypothetical protein WCR24_03980 [Candidatus Methanomethylophilaceae archaeon]
MTVADDVIQYLEDQDVGEEYRLLVRQVSLDTKYNGGQYILIRDVPDSRVPDSVAGVSYHTVSVTVAMGPGDSGMKQAGEVSDTLWKSLELVTDQAINGTFYPLITNSASPSEIQVGEITTFTWNLDIIRYYG